MSENIKAFPCIEWGKEELYGMDLRDWFASHALKGMLSHSKRYQPRLENDLAIEDQPHWHDAISKEAYEIADAMMKARKK